MKFNKNLYIYLDFDGVLNNANQHFGRHEPFRFNSGNVETFYKLMDEIKKIEGLGKIRIVLNTAWKMCNSTRLLNKVRFESPIKSFSLDGTIKDCTKTFKFFSEGDYCLKGYESEHYVIENSLDFDHNIHLVLDDEAVKFNLKRMLNYRTDCFVGLVDDDIPAIVDMIDKDLHYVHNIDMIIDKAIKDGMNI
ncbi:MAG: HAD domain-containing protein [Bacteroidales bacterium]